MKQILFTRLNTAELLDVPDAALPAGGVRVRTAFSTISCGTERANITGDLNINIGAPADPTKPLFPRSAGYSASGIVEAVGEAVTGIAPGDRVAMFASSHKNVNILPASNVVKLPDGVSLEAAALCYIASFSMAAVRKTRVELGESAIVMGQGILGQFAVRFLRAAGAMPLIAVDPVASRREAALQGGADYALDPTAPDFAETVKRLTGGGANVCIEVTGRGEGFDQALDCMARFGRVALLGCTRDKDFTIDYYRKIHGPGITIIGAHTLARPSKESSPGWFTHRDDIAAILRLMAGGRVDLASLITETVSPLDCTEVYTRLVNDKNFGPVVQFDWEGIE